MKRTIVRFAGIGALALVLAGSAIAGGNGNSNGNSANAPGQQKQEEAAAQPPASQPAQAAQPAPASSSSSSSSQSSSVPPGQAKKQQRQSGSSSAAGVKPSNTTTHWTGCTTGGTAGSASSATCSADAGTPNAGPDVSKRYGNGKTASQIAVSRGGVGVHLKGPGNSQPHKVSVCGKPSNKSGGVDVHAVKSYPASCSTSTPPPAAPPAPVNPPQSSTPAPAAPAQSAPATQAPAAPAAMPAPTGGVLGTIATLPAAKPAANAPGGVLGTVGTLPGSTLPFTGFPVWAAVLAALGLLGAGFGLRRAGSSIA